MSHLAERGKKNYFFPTLSKPQNIENWANMVPKRTHITQATTQKYPIGAAKRAQEIPKWGREAGPKKYPNGAAKRAPRNTQMGPQSVPPLEYFLGPASRPHFGISWARFAAPFE